jgi:hypothetical protein
MIACTAICLFGLVAPVTTLRSWQQIDPQQVVDQFYPQSLVDQAEPPGQGAIRAVRKSSYSVLDSTANGTPTRIVACYSNGTGGAIRVIQRDSAGQYAAIYEPSALSLGGEDCNVVLPGQLVDGRPLIQVSFRSTRGPTSDWMFRWNDTSLVSLGPTETDSVGTRSTLLSNAGMVDLDHTGPLKLTSARGSNSLGDEIKTVTWDVYRLSEGTFVFERAFLLLSPFAQAGSQPRTWTESLSLPSGAQGPYQMKVVNGDRGGVGRAASGTIKVNGVTVVGPDLLNGQVEFRTLNVVLAQDNTIEVTLSGAAGGHIWISIQDLGNP